MWQLHFNDVISACILRVRLEVQAMCQRMVGQTNEEKQAEAHTSENRWLYYRTRTLVLGLLYVISCPIPSNCWIISTPHQSQLPSVSCPLYWICYKELARLGCSKAITTVGCWQSNRISGNKYTEQCTSFWGLCQFPRSTAVSCSCTKQRCSFQILDL